MKLRLALLAIFGTIIIIGCQKWNDPQFQAPVWDPNEEIKANQYWTIDWPDRSNMKNILWKHCQSTTNPAWNTAGPDSITKDAGKTLRYLRAVVVSSDEGGNYYKSMVVQDSTGGVELELDMSGLYNFYPVGQKIVLQLNDLVVGDYNNLAQIGWIYNDNQVGRINSLYFDKYIFKDGLPSLKNLPKPLTNNEIDFSGSRRDVNKLVRLENITFQPEAIGKPIASNDFITDWVIYVPKADGSKQAVTVRTSNYAKFRSTIIKANEYNLTGILTIYRNTYQFMIRTKEDIEVIETEPEESVLFNFDTDPLAEGWSVCTAPGSNPWRFRTNSMAHAGNPTNSHVQMDDWLISPTITFDDSANGYLHFEHQLNVQNGYGEAYQVYYTISNATTFNSNDWKVLGTITNFPAAYDWSNHLSISKINSGTFKVAFRYLSTNPDLDTYQWNIRKVEIRNK